MYKILLTVYIFKTYFKYLKNVVTFVLLNMFQFYFKIIQLTFELNQNISKLFFNFK